MSKIVNVTVLVPDATVKSMADEIADGSVDRAIEAAIAAYKGVDSDGQIPTKPYDEDFDNAVAVAQSVANGTEGADLLVIVTDLETNDRARAERLLDELAASGDFVSIVTVSNQGIDTAWAKKLDDEIAGYKSVDVLDVDGLKVPAVALAEAGPWANA